MTDAEERELQALLAEAAALEAQAKKSTAERNWTRTESLGQGAAKGALLSYGDEIGGAVQAAFDKLMPESMGGASPGKSLLELYRRNRDVARAHDDEAKLANPGYFRTGEVGGGVLTGLAVPGGASLGGMAGAGALLGGVEALGDSRADLTSGDGRQYARAALDTGLGAAAGALGGAGGFAAGKLAAPLLRTGGQSLRNLATNVGRKVLLPGGTDSLTRNRALAPEVVQEALNAGAIVPFGTTAGAAKRLDTAAMHSGAAYASIIEELEKRGVRGPEAQSLAVELLRRAEGLESQTMDDGLPKAFREAAEKTVQRAGGEERLGLSQAEGLKRSLQDMARYGKREETPLNEVRREIASMYRHGVEDSIESAARAAGPNSDVAELASGFVPVKQKTGRLIEARDAAERGADKTAQRAALSLPEWLTLLSGGGLSAGMGSTVPTLGTVGSVAGLRLLRTRGPSTIASTAHGASKAAGGLARLAANHPRETARLTAGASGAAERSFDLLGDDERNTILRFLLGTP